MGKQSKEIQDLVSNQMQRIKERKKMSRKGHKISSSTRGISLQIETYQELFPSILIFPSSSHFFQFLYFLFPKNFPFPILTYISFLISPHFCFSGPFFILAQQTQRSMMVPQFMDEKKQNSSTTTYQFWDLEEGIEPFPKDLLLQNKVTISKAEGCSEGPKGCLQSIWFNT